MLENTTEIIVPKNSKFIINNFLGSNEELVELFFKKIKPKIGIVKFKMENWSKFPKSNEEGKILGKNWSKKFSALAGK